MANKVTLEEILQTLKEYKVEAEIPTFGSATVEVKSNELNVVTAEVVWGGYIDIWTNTFRYNISFGEAHNGWSYNDDQGFGYGDFIDDLPTAKEIVEVFFKQVSENPQLTYEKAE
jgi:hypothetical protein